MAYSKHTWVARTGTGLNKFTNSGTATDLVLTPNPDSITQAGTPFSADWMNNIEGSLETAYNTAVTAALIDSRSIAMPTAGTSLANQNWSSVAYGAGVFVAVAGGANNSAMSYSTDGMTWTQASFNSPSVSAQWSSVAYGAGVFVAVAYAPSNPYVEYSSDGMTWTRAILPYTGAWKSVCYGASKFVAVAEDGASVYSSDGMTWTQGDTIGSSVEMSCVIYAATKFIAFPNASRGTYISTNGINWTVQSASSRSWAAAAYGMTGYGSYLVGTIANSNHIYYSTTEGQYWSQRTLPATYNLTSIAFGSGMFVAVDHASNSMVWSPNGVNWVAGTMPSSTSAALWSAVCYGNNKFVAVDYGTASAVSTITTTLKTYDGTIIGNVTV